MTMSPGFREQFISDIFDQQPELAYLGTIGSKNLPESMVRHFRSRTSDFMNRFQQAMGQQLLGGNIPSISPQDFFGGLNFQQEFRNLSPQQRGFGTSRLVPRTQFYFSPSNRTGNR